MFWWTLQNLVIAGLMAGVIWLLCRFGSIGPPVRHALWLVVLLKLVTPPLIAWPWAVPDPLLRLMQNPVETSSAIIPETSRVSASIPPPVVVTRIPPRVDYVLPGMVQPSAATFVAPATATAARARELPASPRVEREQTNQWIPIGLRWAGRLWLAGGILFGCIHLARIARMLKLLRRAEPAGDALLRRVHEIAGHLAVPPVKTRVVAAIRSPLVWCLLRPEMLWPAELPEISESAICGLIVHELAHLKRRDHWVGLIELAGGCLWWWNPLYWYVRRQLRENAELACDAWVVQTLPGGRRAYAEALLSVCENMSGVSRHIFRSAAPLSALGVGGGGRRILERRLAMILREHIPLRIPRLGLLMISVLMAGTIPAWSQRAAELPESTSKRVPMILRMPVVGQVAQNPLPADAQQLLATFEQQEAQERAKLEQQLAERRADLITQLRAMQDRFAKAGQLDEAVAIRDQIRQMTGSGTATPQCPEPVRDPGNVMGLRGQVHRQILVQVTGSADGTVWGHGIYSDDSSIATATVHAGILKPGETGIVRVTLLPGQDHYDAVTANGVTTLSYGPWPGSYALDGPVGSHSVLGVPGSTSVLDEQGALTELRNHVGATFNFNVTGATSGTIWGTGIYSDDSPLAVAAVHAGLVSPGDTGWVRVTILPGQDRYEGSTRNGVTSQNWGVWGGSFRIERGGPPADVPTLRPRARESDPLDDRVVPRQQETPQSGREGSDDALQYKVPPPPPAEVAPGGASN